jgi:hypothetical protein
MAKGEYGFIHFCILPFWSTMNEFVGGEFDFIIDNLKNTEIQWQKIKQMEEDKNALKLKKSVSADSFNQKSSKFSLNAEIIPIKEEEEDKLSLSKLSESKDDSEDYLSENG